MREWEVEGWVSIEGSGESMDVIVVVECDHEPSEQEVWDFIVQTGDLQYGFSRPVPLDD